MGNFNLFLRRLRRCIFNVIYLYLWYKIKDAVQKSTPPEEKIFRDFHSQMLFSLNKLHFSDEKSTNFSPAPAKFVAPTRFGGGVGGRG